MLVRTNPGSCMRWHACMSNSGAPQDTSQVGRDLPDNRSILLGVTSLFFEINVKLLFLLRRTWGILVWRD